MRRTTTGFVFTLPAMNEDVDDLVQDALLRAVEGIEKFGGRPEDDVGVARFLDALATLAQREAGRLSFVLGIDLAHIGRRYGDGFAAQAGRGDMVAVEGRDRERLARVVAGDAAGFWSLVQQDSDPLRWCGASPLYTFLRVAPACRGELLRYEQWNIDPESVVSFAALAFGRAS